MEASLSDQTPPPITPVDGQQLSVAADSQNGSTLNKFSFIELIIKVEKFCLKAISLVLVIHGVINLYQELIEIFYVFPHLPEVFRDLEYTDTGYSSLYRRTILVTATAALETIYGLAIMAHFKELAHRLHILSGIVLIVISFFVSKETSTIEDLDRFHRIPEPPSIQNLIQATTNQERIDLFLNFPTSESE